MTQLAIGEATPHGATYNGHGVNFTLFSAHAERVELCVFDSRGNERRYDLPGRRGDVWHGYLAGARPGLRYGYRVYEEVTYLILKEPKGGNDRKKWNLA